MDGQDSRSTKCTCFRSAWFCRRLTQLFWDVENLRLSQWAWKFAQFMPDCREFLQSRWLKENRKIKDSGRRPTLGDIINFVSVAERENNDPVFGKSTARDMYKGRTKAPKGRGGAGRSFTFTTKPAPTGKLNAHAQPSNAASKPSPPAAPNGKSYPPCPNCGGSHFITQCDSFKALRVKDRIALVHTKGLCVNCFKPGHFGRDCPRQFVCNVDSCGQKHNRMLHLPQAPSSSAAPAVSLTSSFVKARNGKVALPIVAARVHGKDPSTYIDTYALVDPGGTGGMCSEKLAQKLGVSRRRGTFRMTTVMERDKPTEADIVQLSVSDLNDTQRYTMPHVMVQPSLNVGLDNMAAQDQLRMWTHLSDLKLPPTLDADDVQLIIGQNTPELLCPLEVRTGGPGEPFATRTVLGWAINGPIASGEVKTHRSNFISTIENQPSERELIERLWRLENANDEDIAMSRDDQHVIEMWEKSTVKVNGRYSLDIPFKSRPPNLPNNRIMAEHRLKLLGKRLQKNDSLCQKYKDEMHKLIDKQYAEVVTPEELERDDGSVYYLPHHPVINPRKPDKCQIVFDCAANSAGISLNSQVHQGPDLTNKLLGVLMRFRQGPVAFMADIEAMFLQVNVNPEDRDALRFLWWKHDDPTQELEVLCMRSHLFGGVWSPSCVNYALHPTVEDNNKDFDEETQHTVLHNFYVDDCLKSTNTEAEAISLAHEVKRLLCRGGFNLTKWSSNSRNLLASFPGKELASGLHSLDMDFDRLPPERALGLLWNMERDCFQFDISPVTKPLTRRGLLSVVSSVYDPMGFVSPFILGGKRHFQELCPMKLGWDDPIPESIAGSWGRWLNDLPGLKHLDIPRCIIPPDFEVDTAQLHHFADASEYAYGAVTYLKLTSTNGEAHSSFMMLKARLAPLKPTTVPRLELAAAAEAVRLDKTLRRELEISIDESVFWSDSMIVLWYLQHEEKRFQTYVANRVAAIREHSLPHQWQHVPGELNPADDVSRGMSAMEILHSDRWISGPSFLIEPPEAWPQQPNFDCGDLELQAEVKKSPQIYNTIVKEDTIDHLINRFSSRYKLKRAMVWILRFKDYLRGRPPSGPLTLDELQRAEHAIIIFVQKSVFRNDSNLKNLTPLYSPDGILSVGGRLGESNIAEQQKHPWILPSRHHVTMLIIRDNHETVGHAGTERVLAETRRKYWIIKGRVAVRKVLSECVTCKKMRAKPESQLMADLPADRLEPAHPFAKVGTDFFGPFVVKRARSELKRYGCVFTCLVTRAIHIEVTHNLTTDSFLNALQRFIARRGKPDMIRSDNGTNLVGAEAELWRSIAEWNHAKIQTFLQQKDVEWLFNPPAASHMGGVWERQIRTIRDVLRGIVKQQTLDDEALCTLMCTVEGIVNSRPITKLSDDPRDPSPLTPNHLLLLRSSPQLPPGVFVKQEVYKKRWRQVQYLADLFWRRWLAEYLPSLQKRQKWLDSRRNLEIGDLVLVMYENTPRAQWPLGLITDTYPSSDGIVRSVHVKMQTGSYDRPISKICLLEGSTELVDS